MNGPDAFTYAREHAPKPNRPDEPDPRREGPVLIRMADVEAREPKWLWPSRIPLGAVSLLAGRQGEGKGFLTCDIASRVSRGDAWPDGRIAPQGAGDVILISAEDDPHFVLRPRLDAHGADVRRVHLLKMVRRRDEHGETYQTPFSLSDVRALENALDALPECRLIVVDPVGSFIGGRVDAHRDNEVRAVLQPLATLAEGRGVAALLVCHTRKASGASADDNVLGSRAFTGLPRAVWHLRRDHRDKSRRLLLAGKQNLSREDDGLAFTIEGDPACVHWEPEPVVMDADAALAEEAESARPGPDADERERAEAFLMKALAGGPRLGSELTEEAREAEGIAKRTLDRARRELGVEAFRENIPGPWWWGLPGRGDSGIVAPKGREPGDLGNLAKNTGKTAVSEGPDSKVAKLFDLGALGPGDPHDPMMRSLRELNRDGGGA